MKKQIWYVLLTALLCLSMVCLLAACDNESEITTADDGTSVAPNESSTVNDVSSTPNEDSSNTPDEDESSTPSENTSSMSDEDTTSTPGEDTSSTPAEDETPAVNYTEGLEYRTNPDMISYSLIGIGTAHGKEIIIPSEYNGLPVTKIASHAFDALEIERVVISEGITEIAQFAFQDCNYLTDVTLPNTLQSILNSSFDCCNNLIYTTFENSDYLGNETNPYLCLVEVLDSSSASAAIAESTKFIFNSAFSGCTNLTSVTIPDSVTSIGGYAFSRCTSLTSITIGNSVTSIGYDAFSSCTSLTSVTIPDSVTSIGKYAFHGCTSLTSITIPDSVTSIGEYAFHGCTSLTSITIPDSVTSIDDGAFYDCTSLTSITIPDSVTSIGEYAFHGCTSLTSIMIPDSVRIISRLAFYDCTNLTTVYYTGTAEKWGASTTAPWGNDILPDATWYYYSETEPTTSGNYWHYVGGVPTPWGN